MFRRVCDLVHWYLVGLVESVDATVAENAKKLWLEELPASGRRGGDMSKVSNSPSSSGDRNRADSLLARLKRDRPDLAQQVIDGDMSATKAAREAEAWNLELFTICKKR